MLKFNLFVTHANNILPVTQGCYFRSVLLCILLLSIGAQGFSQPAGVSADCQSAYKRALELIQEYDIKLSSGDRSMAENVVDKVVKNGASRADGYNEYGGGEMMQARYISAAWGSLKAATLEWNPRHVSNVGIYLSYLNRLDDATIFLQCAEKMASQSPFVIEARAMLAYRKLDYKTATQLIGQAVNMMPGDMNVRYTAGVIFYKAGDRLRAKQYLQDALRIAPDYKTIIDALKIVDPSGQPNTQPPQDALRKLIAECFQFMDDMLVQGELAGRYIQEMRVMEGTFYGGGVLGGDAYETMRLGVIQSKAEITDLETRARAKQNSARPVSWNATLQACIIAYLTTIANYQYIINERGVDIVIAHALGITPVSLIEKMKPHHGNNTYRYVIQDEKFKYYQIEDPARKTYEAGAKSCESRDDVEACIRPYLETYCTTMIPVWFSHWKKVQANMRTAKAGYPNAAKDYAKRWNLFANQAADYSKRSLSAMKPVTDADLKLIPAASRQMIISTSSPEAHAKMTRDSYQSYIGSITSNLVATTLSQSNEFLMEALETAPDAFLHSSLYIDDCQQKKPDTINLDAEIEKLLAAFKEASEYEVSFEPECELEIGGWKTSFQPFSSDNSANLESSDLKVIVDVANNRWGGEYGKGFDANYGPLTGEVSVKVWGEGQIVGGNADYGVQLEGKVGLGVKKKGVGGFACYFARQTYKFNARAFASALTR